MLIICFLIAFEMTRSHDTDTHALRPKRPPADRHRRVTKQRRSPGTRSIRSPKNIRGFRISKLYYVSAALSLWVKNVLYTPPQNIP